MMGAQGIFGLGGASTGVSDAPLRQGGDYLFWAQLQSTSVNDVIYGTEQTPTHTRSFDCNTYASTGLVVNYAHNVQAFDWDASLRKLRYYSQGPQVNSAVFGGSSDAHRDLTETEWTKTNTTAAKNQTGIDGVSNACSLLTASADGGTATSALTQGSTTGTTSAYLKRSAGYGRVWMTRDAGTTWIDVSNGINPITGVRQTINTSSWTRVSISDTRSNPTIGFRLEYNGDAIIVDCVNSTDSAFLTYPLMTRPHDVRASSLVYTLNPPVVTGTGRRFLLRFNAKLSADASVVSNLIEIRDPAPTTDNWIFGAAITNLAAFAQANRGGVLQLNYNLSAGVPVGIAGQDSLLEFAFGGAQVTAWIDGVHAWTRDMYNNSGLDPLGNLSELAISGSAAFSDVAIREMRGPNVILLGDSQVADIDSGSSRRLLPKLVRDGLDLRQWTVHTRPNPSETLDQITADVSTQLSAYFNSRASANILVIWGGTNTLQDGTSGAQALTDMQELLTACLAVGSWTKVIVVNMLPRSAGLSGGATQSSFNTQRTAFNAGLAALAGVDEVVDIAALTEFDNSTWAASTLYSEDGIHLTENGYSLAAPLVFSAITDGF